MNQINLIFNKGWTIKGAEFTTSQRRRLSQGGITTLKRHFEVSFSSFHIIPSIGVVAIGTLGTRTRKGTCLSGTKKYLSIKLNTRK